MLLWKNSNYKFIKIISRPYLNDNLQQDNRN